MTLTDLGTLLLYGMVVERISEILVTATITAPLRAFLARLAYPPGKPPCEHWWQRQPWRFLTTVLGCGYCTSVWVAMPFYVLPLGWVANWMLLHGAAVLWHGVFRGLADSLQLLRLGRVRTYDITVTVRSQELQSDESGSI